MVAAAAAPAHSASRAPVALDNALTRCGTEFPRGELALHGLGMFRYVWNRQLRSAASPSDQRFHTRYSSPCVKKKRSRAADIGSGGVITPCRPWHVVCQGGQCGGDGCSGGRRAVHLVDEQVLGAIIGGDETCNQFKLDP